MLVRASPSRLVIPRSHIPPNNATARPTNLHQVYVPAPMPPLNHFSAKSSWPVKFVISKVYLIIRMPKAITRGAKIKRILFNGGCAWTRTTDLFIISEVL